MQWQVIPVIKQLDFTQDFSSVKFMDTSTAISLLLTADGAPFDLSTCQAVAVQIANADGYITTRDVDLTSIDDPASGEIVMPVDGELMAILTPDDYKIEVWTIIKPISVTTTSRTATLSIIDGQIEPHTAIFPSDGVLGFTIKENLMNQDGDTIAVISLDEYEQRFSQLETNLTDKVATLQGPKGDTGIQGIQGIQGVKGDKGDTGEQGIQGPKGEAGDTGPQGLKGDTGLTGPQGIQGEMGAQGPKGDTGSIGPQGAKGDTGATGPKGDKGDTGTGLLIKGKVATAESLPTTAAEGDGYIVGSNIYVWSNSAWIEGDSYQGPKGDTGPAGKDGTQIDLSDYPKLSGDNKYSGKNDFPNISLNGNLMSPENNGFINYHGYLLLMAVPPLAPKLAVTMSNDLSATCEVTPPDNSGESAISSYTISYEIDGSNDWISEKIDPNQTSLVLTNLHPNKVYDFKVLATNLAVSGPYSDIIQVKSANTGIYGVSWDKSSDPTLTRTDQSVGLVAGINGAQNDFDDAGPWSQMDKTIIDSFGNEFVRIPKLYIKKSQSDTADTWQVSLANHGDGWYLPKCFWDATGEKEIPYVDVGRYDATLGTSSLESKTGKVAEVNTELAVLRIQAKSNGKGYQLIDIHAVDVLQTLFVIEFATLNSQDVMRGELDSLSGNVNQVCGAGSNHLGSSGFAAINGPMDYRGVENLYGNVDQFIDGVNVADNRAWVCDNPDNYQSNLFASPYQQLNYTLETGWIEENGLDINYPYAQFGSVAVWDKTTYYSDYQSSNITGNYVVTWGGSWRNYSGAGGLFSWNLGRSVYADYADVGSRLLVRPLG